MSSLDQFPLTLLDGTPFDSASLRNKVVLVVNVASRCGFTPQYSGLEALYQRYHAAGLIILAFPCNQFGAQEPGDAAEIARFCSLEYPVTFPVMAKCAVNGPDAHPLYQWLKHQQPGLLGTEAIKWNFTKFLINAQGEVVERFAPQVTPEALAPHIDTLMQPQPYEKKRFHEKFELISFTKWLISKVTKVTKSHEVRYEQHLQTTDYPARRQERRTLRTRHPRVLLPLRALILPPLLSGRFCGLNCFLPPI